MLNAEIKLMAILTGDTQLTQMIPATNILFGPVDTTILTQSELLMPQINLHLVSEVVRSVPLGVRDSIYQLDIWSRINQLEVENIYERVLTLFDFITTNQGGSHIYWQRLGGVDDQYERDMRMWHRSCRFVMWAQ